jgi:FKBP-type peptidyl-prolyl cis-trans isomerase SlyD
MKAQIVSFHCVLKDKLGQVLSSSFNQDVINQLEEKHQNDADGRLRGLVAGIQNVREGERRLFTVPANEAYGPYNPELVLNILRSDLSMGAQLVMGSEIVLRSGPKNLAQAFRVVEAKRDTLMLDGNHPLAGHDLTFEIEIVSARDARSEDFHDSFLTASSTYVH